MPLTRSRSHAGDRNDDDVRDLEDQSALGAANQDPTEVQVRQLQLEVQALRNQLQQAGPAPQHFRGSTAPQGSAAHGAFLLKPQPFDGTVSWEAYQMQFETIAEANGWNDSNKARALVSYLRGKAVEILETIPADLLHDYPTLIAALDARFGDSHLEQLHYAELRSRRQRSGETFPELAASIERLARKSFPSSSPDTISTLATASFLDAIGDVQIQQIVRLGRPTTLRAALVQAVETEAAFRSTERAARTTAISTFSMMNHYESSRPQHCFRCGGIGHFARQCPNEPQETSRPGNASASHRGRARW